MVDPRVPLTHLRAVQIFYSKQSSLSRDEIYSQALDSKQGSCW